jgi:hypothetical protein
MTAEELALMGYHAAPQQGPIQQPSPEELSAIGAGPGVGYPMAVMQGSPNPSVQQFAPQSVAGPQMDPQTIAMANSDPNGLTSGPDGPPWLPLPGNPGSAGNDPTVSNASDMGVSGNAATNPYTPNGSSDRALAAASQTPQTDQSQYAAAAAGFPQLSEWAKASGLPREVMPDERKMIIEKYFDERNAFLARQDPEKLLKIKKDQVELAKSTTEQADAVNKKVDAIQQVEENIRLLDELTAEKGLPYSVGTGRLSSGAYLYGMKKEPVSGTSEADFMSRLDQVQGKNFLTAFNQLRGAGQITEIEGAKAQDALGRLKATQSEGAFRQSVAELRGILQSGLERSQARLGSQGQVAAAPSTATASSSAPMIKTIPGRGTFQSLGNGQWKQIQ